MEVQKVREINDAPLSNTQHTPPPKKKFDVRKIAIPALVALVFGGGYLAYNSYLYVSTDDAQIEGRATLLSAKVGGIIVEANVEENQKVKKGQVLAKIRQDDYTNAVEQAQANLEAAQAQLRGADSNYKRVMNLYKASAYSKDKLDAAEAQYKSLLSQVKGASAALDQAKLNLAYTEIVAPADGRVGKKSFEQGTLAAPGSPLMGFVYDNERWAVANLKETDLENLREGQPAFVEVDALGGKTYKGVVESISPNTGATFSMLPPDNATGNFTKVVQRVPVRIKLNDLTAADIDRLQAGLSVEVSVKVR